MNDNIEYEKFTQEIYNEILKNLYVKNIEVRHNVKLMGKSVENIKSIDPLLYS